MKNKISYTPKDEQKEFPQEKENYCPQCYFDDDLKILRKDCKHGIKQD